MQIHFNLPLNLNFVSAAVFRFENKLWVESLTLKYDKEWAEQLHIDRIQCWILDTTILVVYTLRKEMP